jgi:hypothetical protein
MIRSAILGPTPGNVASCAALAVLTAMRSGVGAIAVGAAVSSSSATLRALIARATVSVSKSASTRSSGR